MLESRNLETPKTGVKRDRFIRIAERRVNKVLDSLENLGKCSNRRNYYYTDEEIRKIFREIDRKVKEIKLQFHWRIGNKHRFKLWEGG